jgi:hypothetical protein
VTISTGELLEALHYSGAYRNPETGLWTWHSDDPPSRIMWHSEEDALRITRACLHLGRPVTDVVTATAWLALVERVIDLERRIEELTTLRRRIGRVAP